MKSRTLSLLLGGALLSLGLAAQAAPTKPECIAPANPGGGFDLTCRLAQEGLKASGALADPMRIVYMPGGIGAVAYNHVIAQKPDDPNSIVAFSGGSLLNLAQKKFGRYNVNDVRWLAAVGTDYGVAVVRDDSPYKNLKDLMAAFKQDPSKIVLGAGGTVGSQDWMKAALTARAAGVDYRKMRFVAMLEGGAPIRVLAVFSDARLPGKLSSVPTAQEEGFDIQWPIIRGFYVGPKVSDADYQWWVNAFDKTQADASFAAIRDKQGLFPFNKSGAELDKYVKERVADYAKLANDFGLIRQ